MKRVWIIDDDQSILEVLHHLLEQENYRVTIIHRAEDVAKKLSEEDAPDVALVDINLAGIDGKKIVQDIRANDKCKETKILIMTAAVHIEEKAKEARADGFIRKPFDIHELLKKIKRYVK